MSSFVNLLDIIYPVDSIYITNSTISPASTIGGSWVQISGAICGNESNNGTNYGSDSHTMSLAEMPKHRHNSNSRVNWYNETTTGLTGTWSSSSHLGVDAGTTYTSYEGSSTAFSIVQNSYGCYVWRRTA
jgi:hypothetical protein